MSWFHNLKNSVLDLSIAFSFDKSGYHRHQQQFDATDLDLDCHGKHYVITGANSGLGKATALAIAKRGGSIHMLCRNPERAEEARQDILAQSNNPNIFTTIIDMSDLENIRAAAPSFAGQPIDALIHNAGILPNTYQPSRQGYESTFATNILGPQLLTILLRENLKTTASSRLIWVSSGGMYPTRLDLKRLQTPKTPFDGVQAYSQTKRAQLELSALWAQKENLWSQSMHPGWADTKGVQNSLPRFQKLMEKRLRSSKEGADCIVWLAIAQKPREEPHACFWFDRKKVSEHYFPWTRTADPQQQELWDVLNSLLTPYLS